MKQIEVLTTENAIFKRNLIYKIAKLKYKNTVSNFNEVKLNDVSLIRFTIEDKNKFEDFIEIIDNVRRIDEHSDIIYRVNYL